MKMLRLLLSLCLMQAIINPVSAQVKPKKIVQKTTAKAVQPADTYSVRFPKNSSSTSVDAYMLGTAHPVTFIIKVKKGHMLKANLSEMADAGNACIQQIILPDGSSSPFSAKTMQYPVSPAKTYKIIIAANNMQGDDWKGAFTLHVAIQ